jgi:two-component system response regulator PilR (NtrC family)
MQLVRETIAAGAQSGLVYISENRAAARAGCVKYTHWGRVSVHTVPVNCGAIPDNLMESEFFGYRKGAFTGADSDREGFFQAAGGGTLFLDEVADLPLAMQVKLLRAIQEKKVRKVGSVVEEPVDVRIICATHKNLRECVEKGLFRQDLYYRLNVSTAVLRRGLEEIQPLVAVLLRRLAMLLHG